LEEDIQSVVCDLTAIGGVETKNNEGSRLVIFGNLPLLYLNTFLWPGLTEEQQKHMAIFVTLITRHSHMFYNCEDGRFYHRGLDKEMGQVMMDIIQTQLATYYQKDQKGEE
jgi:hypothetical protein